LGLLTPNSIDAAILCGGLGTRLRSILGEKPKPMVDINGVPFLEIIYRQLIGAGFRKMVFLTGYQGDVVQAYFHGRRDIFFSQEPSPLGTAGALKFAEPFLSGTILLMNGDSFCDIDFSGFAQFHEKSGALVSIAVVPAGDRNDGGFIRVGSDNNILSFAEKSPGESSFINAGIYLIDPKLLGGIPKNKPCSLEYDIFPFLDVGLVKAYMISQPLFDIGTPERLAEFKEKYSSIGDAL